MTSRTFATLEEACTEYRKIPRDTTESMGKSEAFYKKHVFPLILDSVRQQCLPVEKSYDLLVVTMGTAPEPVALSVGMLRPQRVHFLCDPESERSISAVCELTGFAMGSTHKHYVDKHDSQTIYEKVHEAIQTVADHLGREPRVALDITGGTKMMGASAAMAGTLVNADIFYVATDKFDPVNRRPVPGTEKLVKFVDPYTSFGDMDIRKAIARFERFDYAGASDIFSQVADQVDNPRAYECLAALSDAYEAWNSLSFGTAEEKLRCAVSLCQRFSKRTPLLRSLDLKTLEAQLQSLHRLNLAFSGAQMSLALLQDLDTCAAMLFTVYENARRLEESNKADAACLLFYRSLEMMAQRRLALLDVDTSNVDYPLLGIDPTTDVSRINSGLKLRGRLAVNAPLPEKLPLYLCYVLLRWKKDEYVGEKGGIDLGLLSKLVGIRNSGLFAHGFKPIAKSDFSEFREFIDECLTRFCQAESLDLLALRTRFTFIRLSRSMSPETHSSNEF